MTRAEMIAGLESIEEQFTHWPLSEHGTARRTLRRIRLALEAERVAAGKGGKARAERLSARRRTAIAQKGARAVGRGGNGRFTKREEAEG